MKTSVGAALVGFLYLTTNVAYCFPVSVSIGEPVLSPGTTTNLAIGVDLGSSPITVTGYPNEVLFIDNPDSAAVTINAILRGDVTTQLDVTLDQLTDFASSNPQAFGVSTSGIVSPYYAGSGTLTATYLGISAQIQVDMLLGATVAMLVPVLNFADSSAGLGENLPVASSRTIEQGTTCQIDIIAILSDGTSGIVSRNLTTHYSTTYSTVATVNALGQILGLAPGLTFITAVSHGVSTEASVSVVLPDLTPPQSTLNLGPPLYISSGKTYLSGQSPIQVTATDSGSGVLFSGIAVDSVAIDIWDLTLATQPFTIAGGSHTLTYASIDNALNVEAFRSSDVYIDSAAPVTTFNILGTSYAAAGVLYSAILSTHTLSALDPIISGFASGINASSFSVDGGSLIDGLGPIQLAPGNREIEFRSNDNVGNLESINSVQVVVDTIAPSAITDLRALWPSTSNQVTLDWTNTGNDGLTGNIPYSKFAVQSSSDLATVEWSTASAVFFSSLNVTAGSLQEYLKINLSLSTTHYFRVWTQDQSQNWSDPSNTFSTQTKRDNAPTGLIAADIGISSVAWQWDGVGDWLICYGTSPTVLLSTSAGSPFVQLGLSTNTAYSIAIATSDPAGLNNLAYSVPKYTLAAEPTGLDSSGISSHTISLQWQANTNPPATSYRVPYSTSSGFEAAATTSSVVVSALSVTLPGLSPGTTYHFRNSALNGDGLLSASGNTISSTTLPAAPLIPSSLTGTPLGTSSITWTWNSLAGAKYEFYPSTGGTSISTANASLTQVNLSPNVSYGARISAKDFNGTEGFQSALISTFTLAATPAALSISSQSSSSIDISWNTQGNSTATLYEISISTVSNAFALAVSTPIVFASTFTYSSATVFGLLGGTTYWLRARAQNGAAIVTAFSNSTQTATLPDIPFGIEAAPLGISSIAWTWADQGAAYWKVYSVGGSLLASVSTTSYIKTGLSINAAYGIVAEALNDSGSSGLSDAVTGFSAANPPSADTLTVLSSVSVTAAWTANSNPAGTRFEVSYATTSDYSSAYYVFTTSTTSQSLSGLNPGTSYYFRVRAYNTGSTPTSFADLGTAFTLSEAPRFISGIYSGGSFSSTAQIIPWTQIQVLSIGQPFSGVVASGTTNQMTLGTAGALAAGP